MVLEGELPMKQNFAEYVGKFCFGYQTNDTDGSVGVVRISMTSHVVPKKPLTQKGMLYFLLFDDEKKHWKEARKHWDTSTCLEKKASASLATEILQHKMEYMINIREKVRPRFWYFTFVACDMEVSDAPFVYTVHATNDIAGWQGEFSLDHMGLVTLYGIFTVAFGAATLWTVWQTKWRPSTQSVREHPYLQLLVLSVGSSLASCFCFMVHYILFMKDGFGSHRIRFLGVLAATVANCTIFLIAILSSVGWAISTHVLPGRRFFLGAIAAVGGFSALAEWRSETAIDQSTKLYSYQSTPGAIALMLKVFMFCWFAYQMRETHDLERQILTRQYYKLLGIAFSIWSLNVPVSVVLAFELSPWVRYKTVTIVDMVARFIGQLILIWLLTGDNSPVTEENTFPTRDTQQGDRKSVV